MEIIDTHLHIWDLDKFSLPWLDDEGEILNRTYLLEDYKKSLGENYQISKAVYVEVDSAQDQKDKENEFIVFGTSTKKLWRKSTAKAGQLLFE